MGCESLKQAADPNARLVNIVKNKDPTIRQLWTIDPG